MKPQYVLVPLMLLTSSGLMAMAWLGHLKFKEAPLYVAILASWCIVLPEYVLNVVAIRYGHGTFSGAAMATFNLCTGVIFVALVSAFYLQEPIHGRKIFGFAVLTVAMALVAWKSNPPKSAEGSADLGRSDATGDVAEASRLLAQRTSSAGSGAPSASSEGR